MHFRIAPTLAALLGIALLAALGTWQLHRLDWKRDLVALIAARIEAPPEPIATALAERAAGADVRYRPVQATGVFDHQGEAHVFGTHEGEAGYFIFTPFRTPSGPAFYVNRGFAPQRLKAQETRPEGLVAGPVVMAGLLREAEQRSGLAALLAPVDQPGDNIYYARAPQSFSGPGAEAGFALDWYVDSFGAEAPGLVPRGGLTRVEFPNRHLEYALTWYGLAGALVAVWLAFSRRAGP